MSGGGAIPFITTLDDGSYHVHDEAVKLLETLDGPIATVAVAGLWRTGKSYLLNQLTGNTSQGAGFNVGATVNACTKVCATLRRATVPRNAGVSYTMPVAFVEGCRDSRFLLSRVVSARAVCCWCLRQF